MTFRTMTREEGDVFDRRTRWHEFRQADGSWAKCSQPQLCRECRREAGR